jgi:hypothetical protein
MRAAKSRKHQKVQAKKQMKSYLKNHSLTSRSTFNRRARVVMSAIRCDEPELEYTIVDGIVCTYISETLAGWAR